MIIRVNNMELFYEKTGSGPPLILLHGNGEDHFIFDEIVLMLSKNFTVYCLDTRGHGQSGRVKSLHYQDMADDVACFIETLRLKKPALYGFSDGGIVGLLIACMRPELLGFMVVSGANIDPQGLKRLPYLGFKLLYFFNQDPKLKLLLTEPCITEKDLNRIAIPVYVTAGSRDLIKEEHTKRIAAAIPGSTLKLFPGESHGSYVVHSTKLLQVIEEAAAKSEQ